LFLFAWPFLLKPTIFLRKGDTTIKKSKIDIRVAMHMRVYVMLCKRGPIVVFIADSKRSRSAEKECHLSLLEQIKIDLVKNDQRFTSFEYKNPNKILKTFKSRSVALK
jgi:hypothetical protein